MNKGIFKNINSFFKIMSDLQNDTPGRKNCKSIRVMNQLYLK